MISKYSEILICDLESPRGVKALSIKDAIKYLNEINIDPKADKNDNDFILLNSSKRNRNIAEPLICLRCTLSHDFFAYAKNIYVEKIGL